jgi:hypothetical protein
VHVNRECGGASGHRGCLTGLTSRWRHDLDFCRQGNRPRHFPETADRAQISAGCGGFGKGCFNESKTDDSPLKSSRFQFLIFEL